MRQPRRTRTSTPKPTKTFTPTATPTLTKGRTATPTATGKATSTQTASPTSTDTSIHTPTRTATRTQTRTPTKTLTPTITATVDPGCPDLYEPNDSFAAAYAVLGGVYNARICVAGDEDWFSVNLALGQSLLVNLDNLPKNYDLEVYDLSGAARCASPTIPAPPRRRATSSPIGGTPMGHTGVRVFGVAGAFDAVTPYRLKIEPGPLPTVTETSLPTATRTPTPVCGYDPYEAHGGFDYNDTFEAATSIGVGELDDAYICPDFDRDYFRFSVAENQQIDVLLANLPRDYRLDLLRPDGTIVMSAGDATTNRPTSDLHRLHRRRTMPCSSGPARTETRLIPIPSS